MLQSAAVWRLTHTADRITKSKYVNHCCSPEPSAKSTGPGSGQECLFRGEVDSEVEWLTILLGQLRMAMITYCGRNFEHAMYSKCEQVVALNSAGNYVLISKHMTVKSEDLMNCLESFQGNQVCFGGRRLSCLVLTTCIQLNADQAATKFPNALLTCQLVWIHTCQMYKFEVKEKNIFNVISYKEVTLDGLKVHF